MAKTFQPTIHRDLNEPIAARYARMRDEAEMVRGRTVGEQQQCA